MVHSNNIASGCVGSWAFTLNNYTEADKDWLKGLSKSVTRLIVVLE